MVSVNAIDNLLVYEYQPTFCGYNSEANADILLHYVTISPFLSNRFTVCQNPYLNRFVSAYFFQP